MEPFLSVCIPENVQKTVEIPAFDQFRQEKRGGPSVEKSVESVHNFPYATHFMLLWKPYAQDIFMQNPTFCRKLECGVVECGMESCVICRRGRLH